MANTITGRVYSVGQTQALQTKNGQPFYKRDLIIDATRYDSYTGEKGFENFPMFEFSGDKCKELDGLQVGAVVTVSFDLQGSFFDAQDGTKKNFTRVRGYKIEVKGVPASAQPQYVQQMQQPQQCCQQQPQSMQGQQQAQPQYQQAPPPGRGELPF